MRTIYTPLTYTIGTDDITNSATDLFVKSIYYPRTITMPTYTDLNYDSNIRKRVVNYFYYKTLEKWLYDDDNMTQLLNFFVVEKDKVFLVNSLSDYEKTKKNLLSESKKRTIVNFIGKYLLTKSKMGDFIHKFIKKYSIPFVNLYHNQRAVKKFIGRQLFRKLSKSLERRSK